MNDRIGVAVVGVGYWGRKLVEEYLLLSKRRSDVELVAVADVSKERLMRISSEFGLPTSMLYADHHELLGDDRVDAVHIATPNETHFRIARDFLEAGKHVLLEKPMATSSREAFKLARMAEELDLVLLVGHIFRFNNALKKARDLIEEGAIGEPYYVELRWTARLEPLPKRDVIFDLAPHPIDIVNYLLDEWPSLVSAMAKSYVRKTAGLEEVAFISSELPDDIMAHISLSWLSTGPKIRNVQVVGSGGLIDVDALSQSLTLYRVGGCEKIEVRPNNTIESMISHFVDRIINGDPPCNSALIGAITVSVLEAIRESARLSGQPVKTRVW